jgi:hypothetical protein
MAKVKLYAAEGVTGCSYGGESLKVAKDGTVEVPEEAIDSLLSHGFATSREAIGKPPAPTLESLKRDMNAAQVELAATKAERDQLKADLAASKKG